VKISYLIILILANWVRTPRFGRILRFPWARKNWGSFFPLQPPRGNHMCACVF